jgi:hypothetical protein
MNDDDERLRKNAFAADARRAGFNRMVRNPVAVGRSSRILVFWLVPGVIEVRS